MSWLTRSITATLSSPCDEPDPDDYESETSSADMAADEGSYSPWSLADEEPEQTNTLTCGVKDPQSPWIAGIRSDLAEIRGRVRSRISMLQKNMAVVEISKIASLFLPFGKEEADEGDAVPSVTEEVLVFVRHISTRPERGSISPSSSTNVMQMHG